MGASGAGGEARAGRRAAGLGEAVPSLSSPLLALSRLSLLDGGAEPSAAASGAARPSPALRAAGAEGRRGGGARPGAAPRAARLRAAEAGSGGAADAFRREEPSREAAAGSRSRWRSRPALGRQVRRGPGLLRPGPAREGEERRAERSGALRAPARSRLREEARRSPAAA